LDIATIIGVISGFALVFIAIFIGGGAGTFVNLPSIMITFGGTFAATLINYPLSDILKTIRVLKKAFKKFELEPHNKINEIVRLAQKARKNGLLAIEEDAKKTGDEFLYRGIKLLADGVDIKEVEDTMRQELSEMEERHRRGQSIFRTMGKFAPAFGMLGTLIGLIQMLRFIETPSQIGPGMAVALVTTFYGLLIANLICLPIAGKLEVLSEEESLLKRIVIEGIKAIHAGETPHVIEEKLKAFLTPSLRKLVYRRRYERVKKV